MAEHFADRWLAASAAKGGPVCVGLDPVFERLPRAIRQAHGQEVEAIERFCVGVLDAVAAHVPCVKLQIACFERYRAEGVAAYHRVVSEARSRGLLVIGDVKRGDIGTSAAHYAAGLLAGEDAADAVTVNAYMGVDSLAPFVEVAAAQGKGLFALVRTSNPGGDAIQSLQLGDGRTLSEAVADVVAQAGAGYVGRAGYSLLGAVVGATRPSDAAGLRQRMPQQLFLVPGFGAQGGTAGDVRACFKADGAGAIVTASRSVIYAFAGQGEGDWQSAVEQAAEKLKREVAAAART